MQPWPQGWLTETLLGPGPVEGGLARAMIRETAVTQGRSEQESYDELTAPMTLVARSCGGHCRGWPAGW